MLNRTRGFRKEVYTSTVLRRVATKLYGKRKQQVLEGKKLPDMFRKPSVNFNQLADDALAYSKRNKRSYKTDVRRFANLKEWFAVHAA